MIDLKQLVNKITILRLEGGTDTILLQCNSLDSPFPELNKQAPGDYPTCLRQECRRGYAETWLSNVGFGGRCADLVTMDGKQTIVIP